MASLDRIISKQGVGGKDKYDTFDLTAVDLTGQKSGRDMLQP